jgi:hypothetical protein
MWRWSVSAASVSWAAEGLARFGDRPDHPDRPWTSSSNRTSTDRCMRSTGNSAKAKVSAMAQRIRSINRDCEVREIDDFVTPGERRQAFSEGVFDYLIDAIDQVRSKVAMIAWSRRCAVPLITAGGAGGQIDPTRIAVARPRVHHPGSAARQGARTPAQGARVLPVKPGRSSESRRCFFQRTPCAIRSASDSCEPPRDAGLA